MRYLAENGTCRTSCPDRYFRRPAAAAVETAVPQLTVARPSAVFGVDGIMTPGSCEVEDYGCVWKWEIKPQNCALIIRDNQFDDESTLFPDNPPMILRWDLLQLRIGGECEKCVGDCRECVSEGECAVCEMLGGAEDISFLWLDYHPPTMAS